MESTINTMLALEKLNKASQHLVYTYILAPEGTTTCKGYFIPLKVVSDAEIAEEKAKEIIQLTGYPEILTFPMGRWIPLGTSLDEKVSLVETRKDLEAYGEEQDRKRDKLHRERERINKEIQVEQKARKDPDSIESYYYDWICAVQNKAFIERSRQDLLEVEAAYKHRLANLQTKTQHHPEYASQWKDLLRTRLTSRGEGYEAEAIIAASEAIAIDNTTTIIS